MCLAAAAFAAVIGPAIQPASAEKICQPRLESGATHGPIRASVEARAIVVWSADVTDRHALRYANWNNATARNVSCRRYTSAIGVNLWECRASANPCRLR
jgi:hypothetical protein